MNLLECVKENNGVKTTDFWNKGDQSPKTIGEMQYTFSNYQTILIHLTNAGMLAGKKGGVYKISSKFCHFLDNASDCWRRWYRAENNKDSLFNRE